MNITLKKWKKNAAFSLTQIPFQNLTKVWSQMWLVGLFYIFSFILKMNLLNVNNYQEFGQCGLYQKKKKRKEKKRKANLKMRYPSLLLQY